MYSASTLLPGALLSSSMGKFTDDHYRWVKSTVVDYRSVKSTVDHYRWIKSTVDDYRSVKSTVDHYR